MEYSIDRDTDGHPIIYNNVSLTKKEVVHELNSQLATITSLYRDLKMYNEYTIKDIELKAIAKFIHYPACWDVVAYPTIQAAMAEFTPCQNCIG